MQVSRRPIMSPGIKGRAWPQLWQLRRRSGMSISQVRVARWSIGPSGCQTGGERIETRATSSVLARSAPRTKIRQRGRPDGTQCNPASRSHARRTVRRASASKREPRNRSDGTHASIPSTQCMPQPPHSAVRGRTDLPARSRAPEACHTPSRCLRPDPVLSPRSDDMARSRRPSSCPYAGCNRDSGRASYRRS